MLWVNSLIFYPRFSLESPGPPASPAARGSCFVSFLFSYSCAPRNEPAAKVTSVVGMFVRTSRRATSAHVYGCTHVRVDECTYLCTCRVRTHMCTCLRVPRGEKGFFLVSFRGFKIVNLEELPLIPFSILRPSCHLLKHSSDNLAIRGF